MGPARWAVRLSAAACCADRAALPAAAGAGGADALGDETEDCWTYKGVDSVLGVRTESLAFLCCRPSPCGDEGCWAPPSFTFDFCCRRPACSPAVAAALQEAVSAVGLGSIALRNASGVARGRASAAVRVLLRDLRGLTLNRVDGKHGCSCALAYAVAVLLAPGGAASKLAQDTLTTKWLAHGIDWRQAVSSGWGPLFALLAAGPRRSSAPLPSDPARAADLDELLEAEQAQVRAVVDSVAESSGGDASFSDFVAAVRDMGVWDRVWTSIDTDLSARRAGRKCTAAPAEEEGHGEWTSCVPWSYDMDADFSSPDPDAGARANASVAVCVLGAPRSIHETYASIQRYVVKAVAGNAFIYVPFPKLLSRTLEAQLRRLGPAVTAIAVPDVDADGMEERLNSELYDPRISGLYTLAPGPWRAPLYGQMGSSMWGYHNQHACQRMVTAHEEQRGQLYEWVIFARADMLWLHNHPPIGVLDPRFVYVPFGQDNSFYANGSEPGLNDRHAAVPRALVPGYFGRWDALRSGRAWPEYLGGVAEADVEINTEQYLLLHLRASGVEVRRFPPVAFLVACTEGPQCQHLFKGTTLRDRKWAFSAKYVSELTEVRRTIHDDLLAVNRPKYDWIWSPLRPHAPLPGPEDGPADFWQPWEFFGLDLACCLSRGGPVSCPRWHFRRRCQCLP